MANEADALEAGRAPAGTLPVPGLLTEVADTGALQAKIPPVEAPVVEVPRVAVAQVEVEVLRALAHPVRWGIVRRLAAEPGICACDFTEFFDVSQPTISAHLKVLREAGLVTTRRNGTTICYSIAPDRLESLSRVLAGMAATAVDSDIST